MSAICKAQRKLAYAGIDRTACVSWMLSSVLKFGNCAHSCSHTTTHQPSAKPLLAFLKETLPLLVALPHAQSTAKDTADTCAELAEDVSA